MYCGTDGGMEFRQPILNPVDFTCIPHWAREFTVIETDNIRHIAPYRRAEVHLCSYDRRCKLFKVIDGNKKEPG